jgi:hypothetical protein
MEPSIILGSAHFQPWCNSSRMRSGVRPIFFKTSSAEKLSACKAAPTRSEATTILKQAAKNPYNFKRSKLQRFNYERSWLIPHQRLRWSIARPAARPAVSGTAPNGRGQRR